MTAFVFDESQITNIGLALVTVVGGANIWYQRQVATELKLFRLHIIKGDKRLDKIELRMANCKKCPTEEQLGIKDIPTLEEVRLENLDPLKYISPGG